MTDFIYCGRRQRPGRLKLILQSVQEARSFEVTEFHGSWGSLAVADSTYPGFQTFQTPTAITTVVGGPLLGGSRSLVVGAENTHRVAQAWEAGGVRALQEQLSGPFAILRLEKATHEVTVLTDLMGLIPVYTGQVAEMMAVGTHVDAVAEALGSTDIDTTSVLDFIVHGTVTYPYTCYRSLRQLAPASVHTWTWPRYDKPSVEIYWEPREQPDFDLTSEQAGEELRNSLQEFVSGATEGCEEVGVFLSGGEDSRLVASLVPPGPRKLGYVFLEGRNREGSVAQKVADRLGIDLTFGLRRTTHYLDCLEPVSRLIGLGAEAAHSHTYGFHEEFNLGALPAVLGGYFSDVLIKGCDIRQFPPSGRMPIFPEVRIPGRRRQKVLAESAFPNEMAQGVLARREAHYDYLRTIRPRSADEWSTFWPASMDMGNPNIAINRRLFASFEPFTASGVIRLAAAVPQSWKLNRRLFWAAAHPKLARTKDIAHADGSFPHLPWHINLLRRGPTWLSRTIRRKLSRDTANEGPWNVWGRDLASPEWRELVRRVTRAGRYISPALTPERINDLLEGTELKEIQRFNLLQVLQHLGRLKG